MNYFLRPGSYWVKGFSRITLTAGEFRRLFPVALDKDGGKGDHLRGQSAASMPSPNMAAFCARPPWFTHVALHHQSVAMAAAFAAFRRFGDLLTRRELPLDLWASVELSCCHRDNRTGRPVQGHSGFEPLTKLTGLCAPIQRAYVLQLAR